MVKNHQNRIPHGQHRLILTAITLSLLISSIAASQDTVQDKIISILKNPITLSDHAFKTILEGTSIKEVTNDQTQPTQTTFTLNLTDPTFSYTQDKLHDNVSTVTEEGAGSNLRFTINGSMPNGQNQTMWLRLPKNITLTNTSMGVAGLMSSSMAVAGSKAYSVAVGELSGAFDGREVVIGTDSGDLMVFSSSGAEITALSKSLNYPIYAVDVGDLSSQTQVDYIGGLSNGTVYAFNRIGQTLWSYTASNFPVYAVKAGNITKGVYDDVLFGTWDRKVVLLNASGHHVWNYTVGSEVHDISIGNLSADDGNEIVIASYDGYVYVLNRTGSQLWNYSGGGWVMGVAVGDFNTSSPGNEVVYTSSDFSIYVLNSTGDGLLYSFPTGSHAQSAAIGDVLQDNGNELVIGSWDKIAYLINTTGNATENRTTGGFVYDVEIADAFSEAGLEVLVASGDGTVYIMNFRYFTKDPFIDIASSGTPYEWNYSGIYRGTESLNGSFASLIQIQLNLCNSTFCDIQFLV